MGLKILGVDFNDVNGGSFVVKVATINSKHKADAQRIQATLRMEQEQRLDDLTPYEAFRERIFQHKNDLRQLLNKIKRDGQVVFGYGASTKGNVLLQFCQITPEEVPFIAEVNEDKYGCYTPGSRIPIISECEARERRPDYFMVLPWHFRESIINKEKGYLKSEGHLLFPLPSITVV